MKRLLWMFPFTAALFAAYQPYQVDTFTSGPSTNWNLTGTVNVGPAGLNINSSWTSSLISTVPVPDGTADYEVRMTLKLTQSGGTYMAYVRSTPDASTYYTVALQDVVFNGPMCSAPLNVWKVVPGSAWLMASMQVPCHDGMNIRAIIRGSYLYVFTDNQFRYTVADGDLVGGVGGVGGRQMPSGNTISKVEIGPADRIAPNPVDLRTVRISTSANCVDMVFQPPTDDVNGTGVQAFLLLRNGAVIGAPYDGGASDCGLTAGTTYTYTVQSIDYHSNFSSSVSLNATTAPAGSIEPRRIGVHGLGAYWGAGGEQIDMRSGNLNFSIPLLKAMGRGGWGVPFGLNYNSQLWRQDSGGVWKLGADIGFGYGWRLLAGSVTPYWYGATALAYYVFTDSTGAEYKLDQNSGGVWTSKEGTYLSFDANTQTLWFTDGSRWIMGCTSAGTEQDAGTMYPTVMQDSNGNQILVRYQSGIGTGWVDSSSRITEIEDVRARTNAYGTWMTYSFQYNNDAIPHLINVGNLIGTGERFIPTYTAQSLTAPWPAGPYNAETTLTQLQNAVGQSHRFEYDGSAELTKLTFPQGAYLRYEYRDSIFSGSRVLREVAYRYLAPIGATETRHDFTVSQGLYINNSFYQWTRVEDTSSNARKQWDFNSEGLAATYSEKSSVPETTYRSQSFTWTATGNKYLASVTTTLENGLQTKTDQTLDAYGNLTQRQIYDYGQSTPKRTYNNSYLTAANYISLYVRNRLVSSTVTPQGGQTVTLVTQSYDSPGDYLYAPDRPGARRFLYVPPYYRGNVSVRQTPGAVTGLYHDILGMVYQTTDGQGHTTAATPDASKDYAVPSQVTPFNTASLATNLTWNSFLGLTNETGPNGASASATYDGNARPQMTTSPHGAQTTYEYNDAQRWVKATTNGRWIKTTTDGLGRTVLVEKGDAAGTKSKAESEYAPCACSPMGKLYRTAQPHAEGGTVNWTTYTYDALGRTTSVKLADNSQTTYLYVGNTVKVTDAAGKWKTHTMDALGNLVTVTEPVVGDTNYTYDAVGHLTQVSMVRGGTTQLRTFVYDATTQRLMSATNPETATVTYAYNADGTLLSKTDAKNQRIQYTYDDKQRVTSINRYNGQTLDYCASQTFTYDSGDAFSENTVGRLVKEEWTNPGCANDWNFVQTHSYTPAGLRTKKKLQVHRFRNDVDEWRTIGGEDQSSFFSYDNEGRVAAGEGWTYVYDTMGRLSQMKDGAGTVTASATYGAAGQMLTMWWKNGGGPNTYISETREYNSLLQLTRQSSGGVDIEYRYPAGANNGRISSQKENVTGEEVTYQYDELNRLIAATTTGPQWGLSFGYDGFGNRTTQTVTKGTAPQVQLSYDGSTNRVNTPGWSHDANGNVTAMPLLTLDYDGYNRLSYSNHSSQGAAYYGYDPSNKRVWQTDVNGVDKFTYYNVLGQRTGNGNVYFAGRLIMSDGGSVVTDRLGSVRRRMDVYGSWGPQMNYFPYGEEEVVTASDKEKFGTYLRDQKTNLDYADQRYFASGFGRFQTPDSAPADPTNPQSWNRYSYVHGDPVNLNDPDGRLPMTVTFGSACDPFYLDPWQMSACIMGTGAMASVSPTMRAWEIFDPLTGIIDDWDYANQYGTAFNVTISGELFNSMVLGGAAVWETAGVIRIGGVLVRVVVTAGAIASSPVVMTAVGVAAAATIGYLIYKAAKVSNVIRDVEKEEGCRKATEKDIERIQRDIERWKKTGGGKPGDNTSEDDLKDIIRNVLCN